MVLTDIVLLVDRLLDYLSSREATGRQLQRGERRSEGESGQEASLIPATSGGVVIDSHSSSVQCSSITRDSERQDQ